MNMDHEIQLVVWYWLHCYCRDGTYYLLEEEGKYSSDRNTLLHWGPLAKNTFFHAVHNHPVVEDFYKLLKIWQSLQFLNEHSELLCRCQYFSNCVTKQLETHIWFFIKRPHSFDFFNVTESFGNSRSKEGQCTVGFLFHLFPLHRWHYGISSHIHSTLFVCLFLVTWTLSENFKFRFCVPRWQTSTLA